MRVGLPLPGMPGRETLARAQVLRRSWPFVLDVGIGLAGLAAFYCVVLVARFWAGPPNTQMVVSLSPRALPAYAFYSVVRIALAYGLSLLFAVGYGYTAAYSQRAEAFLLAVLDILQSIPVLSFLPGVMLAMVGLFPTRHLGVELGAIVLIFTGAVWNMAFSFYSSLKSIPRELLEATRVYRFSALQRLLRLELPYAAIGLVWNSIISVAGAWFFLMACEMFHFRDRDFRLPGLGSYLQTAADAGNGTAMAWGLATMVAIIVLTDQLVWRPLIAWSDRFKFEQVESSQRVTSPVLHLLQHSHGLQVLREHTLDPLGERLALRAARNRQRRAEREAEQPPEVKAGQSWVGRAVLVVLGIVVAGVLGYLVVQSIALLRPVQGRQYLRLLEGAAATFARVNVSLLLAAAWTIPAGVAIGFHPKLARIAQPLAQIAASVPATALFPILLLALVRLGGGLGIGSVALMLLGTQWYILFNVIAGALAIPTDLKEVSALFGFSSLQRWRTVILPGIFPFLVTGMVTASGGAWNASIIAEYFRLNNRTLETLGLGAQISEATEAGQFPILLLGTVLISLMVVTTNRLVWRPMYRLAETRYRLMA